MADYLLFYLFKVFCVFYLFWYVLELAFIRILLLSIGILNETIENIFLGILFVWMNLFDIFFLVLNFSLNCNTCFRTIYIVLINFDLIFLYRWTETLNLLILDLRFIRIILRLRIYLMAWRWSLVILESLQCKESWVFLLLFLF